MFFSLPLGICSYAKIRGIISQAMIGNNLRCLGAFQSSKSLILNMIISYAKIIHIRFQIS